MVGRTTDPGTGHYSSCVEELPGRNELCNASFTINWSTLRDSCIKQQRELAIHQGTEKWKLALDTFQQNFLAGHFNKCFGKLLDEQFRYEYTNNEYHYTLYYYDQAGNLVQTVPPAGVDILPSSAFDSNGNYLYAAEPNHRLKTNYKYNSLNQLISQCTPDAGKTNFIYDRKSQLRMSQNAKQKAPSSGTHNVYSYTLYDPQGRITEVGEAHDINKTVAYLTDTLNNLDVLALLDDASYPTGSGTRVDVTQTTYDTGSGSNLRGRVASVSVQTTYGTTDASTQYSYDAHGNVSQLTQQLTGIGSRTIDYEYDLISGKVNDVYYQKGKSDQYTHRYRYDADNRITSMQTSSDGLIWEEDARYFYYKHGPLGRIEFGEDKVQGLDYYYTLQGWLKGVNIPAPRIWKGVWFSTVAALGLDGIKYLPSDSIYDQGGINIFRKQHLNRFIAADQFAYTLSYYRGDYKPVSTAPAGSKNGNLSPTADLFNTAVQFGILQDGLYNGNITGMATQVHSLNDLLAAGNENYGLRSQAFQYDQLNRLTQAESYDIGSGAASNWNLRSSTPNSGAFDASYTYDGNGNILTAKVNGNSSSLMDDLSYRYDYYNDGTRDWLRSNRLYHVNDGVGASLGTDIGDEGTFTANATTPYKLSPTPGVVNTANNYSYDEIGNLIHDESEEIDTIKWNVYGKVRSVIRTSGSTKPRLDFTYDGAGNRVMKKVTAYGGSVEITYYVRDASGNVMAVCDSSSTSYDLEYPKYGSSRVGLKRYDTVRTAISVTGPYTSNSYEYRPSKSEYELSNHLGNVYVTLPGLKLGWDTTGDGKADIYQVNPITTHDYYAFGMEIGSRSYSASGYRYGFNGKEKNTEWDGSIYDYGFRIYNPKLGRFLSVDPLTPSYPWYTPYQFAGNKPIWCVDLDGLEELEYKNIPASGFKKIVHAGDVVDYMGYQYRVVNSQVVNNNYIMDGDKRFAKTDYAPGNYKMGRGERFGNQFVHQLPIKKGTSIMPGMGRSQQQWIEVQKLPDQLVDLELEIDWSSKTRWLYDEKTGQPLTIKNFSTKALNGLVDKLSKDINESDYVVDIYFETETMKNKTLRALEKKGIDIKNDINVVKEKILNDNSDNKGATTVQYTTGKNKKTKQ
jgi:RHS repeat-associated protein